MSVVKRDGKWRLEKKKEGVYLITERRENVAKAITSDYEPEGMMNDERSSLSLEVREVKDFKGAKEVFNQYVTGERSTGLI